MFDYHRLLNLSELRLLVALTEQPEITQQELADAINVTRVTINAIENGNYNPSLELAFRLSKYFSTDIQNIFYLEGNNETIK